MGFCDNQGANGAMARGPNSAQKGRTLAPSAVIRPTPTAKRQAEIPKGGLSPRDSMPRTSDTHVRFIPGHYRGSKPPAIFRSRQIRALQDTGRPSAYRFTLEMVAPMIIGRLSMESRIRWPKWANRSAYRNILSWAAVSVILIHVPHRLRRGLWHCYGVWNC